VSHRMAGPVASATGEDLADLERRFDREIFPLLMPVAVEPSRPVPFVPSLALNLAVLVDQPRRRHARLAIVHLAKALSPFIPLGARGADAPLQDVVVFFLPRLFPNADILEKSFFRMCQVVDARPRTSRLRASRVTRLDVSTSISERLLTLLTRELRVGPRRVHRGFIVTEPS
jgi:polyphosphate kinase